MISRLPLHLFTLSLALGTSYNGLPARCEPASSPSLAIKSEKSPTRQAATDRGSFSRSNPELPKGIVEASPPRRKSRPPSPSASVDSLPPEILDRLWESAPGLALEWPCRTDPAAVDAVLARYSLPVHSFDFFLRQGSFRRVGDWVSLLARKGVQILKLHFSRNRDRRCDWDGLLDDAIFSCRELTSLHLSGGCEIPAAPLGFAGFPKLTTLCLQHVRFPDNGMTGLEALISASPLLEVLRLVGLWFTEDHWVIQAPNLRMRFHLLRKWRSYPAITLTTMISRRYSQG
ncbi:hypothetical protein SETIT_6G175400v2 [Setaria italica]|uniref:F-box/LRR-repeat protein 15/At3g58940/PEG3-like LRR domain-containing protein n=1 Tax=Setaria italica TaxID=4555 RepID=A0A368RMJ8_SETIT|nr:hypothetical protein SETIT_6G175400v2 [Setaria italica]